MELDRVIHEPGRLRIMMILSGLDTADFNFLRSTLGMSKGNLSRHAEKLESAGYIKITKSFKGKIPNTSYKITQKGANELTEYWKRIDDIRQSGPL